MLVEDQQMHAFIFSLFFFLIPMHVLSIMDAVYPNQLQGLI